MIELSADAAVALSVVVGVGHTGFAGKAKRACLEKSLQR
jgi:hypothetical protein